MSLSAEASTPHHSDQQLLQLVQQGDTSAFETLLHRYRALILSVARKWGKIRVAESEEILQEVSLLLYEKAEKIQRVRPWLIGTTINKCKELYRAHRYEEQKLKELKDDPTLNGNLGEEIEEIEQWYLVRQSLDALNHFCRDLLTNYYFLGMSQSEIGANMNLPMGSIHSRMSQCLKQLRVNISNQSDK